MKDYNKIINEISRDKSLSLEQKRILLAQIKEERDNEAQREFYVKNAKNWIGGAIIILSTLIPATAILKAIGITAKTVPFVARLAPAAVKLLSTQLKLAKPLINQIVINMLKQSFVEGSLQGLLYGIGTSIQFDKNLKESAEEITSSIISGIFFNAILSAFGLSLKLALPDSMRRIKELEALLDKRKDWGIAFRKASGNLDLAIATLLKNQKGFVPNAFYKKKIGHVDLVWGEHNLQTGYGYGMKHFIGQRNTHKIDIIKFLQLLSRTVKKGKVSKDVKHPLNKYIIDKNLKIGIVPDWNGKNRNWIITSYPINKKIAKRLAACAPMSNPYDVSRYTIFTNKLGYGRSISTLNNKVNQQLVNKYAQAIKRVLLLLILQNLINNNTKPINKINNKPMGFNTPQPVMNNNMYYTPQIKCLLMKFQIQAW